MTTIIFATCMAGLYSWWVWDLKRELATVHTHAPAGSGGTPKLMDPPPAVAAHSGSHVISHVVPHAPSSRPVQAIPSVHAEPAAAAKRRRADGVPVWTIG